MTSARNIAQWIRQENPDISEEEVLERFLAAVKNDLEAKQDLKLAYDRAVDQAQRAVLDAHEQIACPLVYADGRKCSGHITHIEVYNADIEWRPNAAGEWRQSVSPRSHYHLFCSEKSNHAGALQSDDSRLKFRLNELPADILAALFPSGSRS